MKLLSLYREAFEAHVDECDQCDWITLSLCHVGRKLQTAYSQACADLMAPIPVMLPRPQAKA